MYQWGKPQAQIYRGNAEGAKLPRRYVAEKTKPGASELKKSPSSLRKYKLCNNSIEISQEYFYASFMDLTFPLDLSCGLYPLFFIRELEKQAAHIAIELLSSKLTGLP
jgi:hypothetical protein